jgi:hypothetical protein
MASLSREHRKLLENTVANARKAAVSGAAKALNALRVGDKESPADPAQRDLRNQLRAHGRQLGDVRQADGSQETRRLEQACAYEHWHRMLFARFLAENDLLVNPDYGGVAMSLEEIQETARELNRDWLSLASEYAQRMLLEVFRPDDPVLSVLLPPETRQELEESLAKLPAAIFTADDSLGWVYQFWQRDEKERVNKLERPIGAEELSPVTQLFTEDYMVLFLLHNTLGAWWTAKRRAEGKSHQLDGYEWSYLRLNDDGSPASGNFDGWPRTARELRVLDPCMGSGHFLTFALPILTRIRMVEEGLSLAEALHATLADNLFGLELDPRCSQIAAFNLALTAWRAVGRPMALPSLNLACSGLGIFASEEAWLRLAGNNRNVRFALQQTYKLFQKAPTFGSLIDPARHQRGFLDLDQIWPFVEEALSSEQSTDESQELAVAAKGVLAAARMLAKQYTLVATNVPYLGTRKQGVDLKQYCHTFHSDAKADLATCFIDRCLRFCCVGGSVALVTPQNWLFLTSYKKLRERLLREEQWNLVVSLGERAFESTAAAGAFAALFAFTHRTPETNHSFSGWDVGSERTASEKAKLLMNMDPHHPTQRSQFDNAGHVITLIDSAATSLLRKYSKGLAGILNGDTNRFEAFFWEVQAHGAVWEFEQSTVKSTQLYGGREKVILWEGGNGRLRKFAKEVRERLHDADRRGNEAWGKLGVAISQMRTLPATISTGEKFDANVAVILPHNPEHLPAIWAYCSSDEFLASVRQITQRINVTNATLVNVEFDLDRWKAVALEKFPDGLPRPSTTDPTQWLFDGDPSSANQPLQVGVSRLLGYRWPRQTGSNFVGCPALSEICLHHHADIDGIVCLQSVHGEATGADRLRALLAEVYGEQWSASKLAQLIGNAQSLEVWLASKFFEEHCELFHSRPFIWHIWDGRDDGFHSFINYQTLAGANGEGRRTLEKLIYTSLGDWITRQQAEVDSGVDGAEGRLLAARHLRAELTNILTGEPPYDLFIRWKPLHEQPMGWDPDINDGVRLNMRPWLHAKPYQATKRDACILRVTPIKLPLGKDRGKEPLRSAEDFPWYATSQDRTNDLHFTLAEKQQARERRKKEGRDV